MDPVHGVKPTGFTLLSGDWRRARMTEKTVTNPFRVIQQICKAHKNHCFMCPFYGDFKIGSCLVGGDPAQHLPLKWNVDAILRKVNKYNGNQNENKVKSDKM